MSNELIIESLKPLEADIKTIKTDPRNARKHNERNIETIKNSLKTYGQRKPIVVNTNTNTIEAGNGMYQAAKELGWDKIAVVFVDDAQEVATAYGLMDNQSALISEWDLPTLKDLLTELDDGEVNMDLTGFSSKEIEDMMTQLYTPEEGLTDDDAIPENVETICKKGDLWQLGEHRLLCGDSTAITDVERLMQGEKADMVFTDPPYGIDLDTQYKRTMKPSFAKAKGLPASAGRNYQPVIGDDKDFDPSFLMAYFDYCKEQFWWGADYYSALIPDIQKGSWIVWDKRDEGLDKALGSSFEMCWSRQRHRREIARIRWCFIFGTEKEPERKRFHPTQKPIDLVLWFFSRYKGEIIVDLFGGSGSTLIACEKLSRKCRMMEIDEHYCDVIIKRWEDYTGKKAELIL